MTSPSILALAKVVAERRREQAALAAKVAQLREEFTALNALLFDQYADAKARTEEAEQYCKEQASAVWAATGDKEPAPGVKVKMKTTLVYDPADALQWAKVAGLALQLDTKAFEKIAKATPVACVATVEEPQVTLATDLDATLPRCAEPGCTETGTIPFMDTVVCEVHYLDATEAAP